ncbi:hypothetical protein V6R21_06980 [Limibacter armeniacum]|uniref:hypothetical protein n=1 Tax=Limibacter armeniacum TaxID=466084 RepID=UPI002FE695C9
MIRNLLIIGVFIVICFSNCGNESEEGILNEQNNMLPDSTCSEAVFYETDIAPIIQVNCAIGGCHLDTQSPNFLNYGDVFSNRNSIRQRTASGSMPPNTSGLTLTATEIQTISCWVRQGAPE